MESWASSDYLQIVAQRIWRIWFFWRVLNPKGESKQLTALIKELQITLKQISGQEFSEDAIKQQMAFALTKQKEFKHRGHIYSWIMNVAAALEAGYIKSSILPDVTLSDKT